MIGYCSFPNRLYLQSFEGEDLLHCPGDSVCLGNHMLLQIFSVGHGHVDSCDSLHWTFEVIKG